MHSAGPLVARPAKAHDKHFVLRDPLMIEMHDMMLLLSRSAAYAIRIFRSDPIAVAALRGVHRLERHIIIKLASERWGGLDRRRGLNNLFG